jgi:hypothetical protein
VKRIRLGIVAFALAFLVLLNVRLHRPGSPSTVDAQLRHLEYSLRHGAASDMQTLFPEGYVFTWSLYGLASAQRAGQLDPGNPRRAHLLAETRRALSAIHSNEGRAVFEVELDPPYGAFYASWSLYVLAEYVRAVGPEHLPPEARTEFTRECDRFARALAASGTPFLETYSQQVWPADTAPGIAALGIHDALLEPRYAAVIRKWVADARPRMQPPLQALSHAAEPGTGRPKGGVRGESLALMSRLLIDADSAFAREQYAVLREHFLDDVLGVPGVLEYPRDVNGSGDVDTGPLAFGFSGPAIVVGAAAARVHGDPQVADGLLGGVELVGVPIELRGRRSYAFGRLAVGDAFIAWARTSPAGAKTIPGWKELPGWFLPFHLISAGIAGLLLWWAYRIMWPRRRRRPFEGSGRGVSEQRVEALR